MSNALNPTPADVRRWAERSPTWQAATTEPVITVARAATICADHNTSLSTFRANGGVIVKGCVRTASLLAWLGY